jgi:hypothetical protein
MIIIIVNVMGQIIIMAIYWGIWTQIEITCRMPGWQPRYSLRQGTVENDNCRNGAEVSHYFYLCAPKGLSMILVHRYNHHA